MTCRQVADAFEICGGDLVGTWDLVTVCKENRIGEGFDCDGFAGDMTKDYSPEYSLTFDETEVSLPETTLTNALDVTIPLSCTPLLGEDIESCSELSGPESGTCTGDEICRCRMEEVRDLPAIARSYEISPEGGLRIDADGEYNYCIHGRSLYVVGHGLGEGHSGDNFVYKFMRR